MSATRSGYVVALTGGIAAGKSAVSRRFEDLGIAVYDADVAARAVVARGSEGLMAIVDAFGSDVLDEQDALDRPAMRRRVFGDETLRRKLENIIHPRVRQWLRDHVLADTGAYCLLAIPLLAENIEHYRWVDRVLLVDANDQTRLKRLIERDGIDPVLAASMLARQARREDRLAIADDVIENDGVEDALALQVERLHHRYLALAGIASRESPNRH